MEDMSKDIIKEELNSDDLMRIDNYIKNELVPQIKKISIALGDGVKRMIEEEKPIAKKLRAHIKK